MDNCPIPVDLDVQRYWRDHKTVTDEMVAWLKKEAGCGPNDGIMDMGNRKHNAIFGTKRPKGRRAWLLIHQEPGVLNVYKQQTFYTDKNGRNLEYYKE